MPAVGNRTIVNAFLLIFLPVLAIDAIRPMTPVQVTLARLIDDPLDVTGLWQGPWKLYAPEVDRVNLRLTAEVVFADQTKVAWESPDWSKMSAFGKLIEARHLNYWNNVLNPDMQPAWDGLCAYLARTVKRTDGGDPEVLGVVLKLRGAYVPDPTTPVPAAPYLAFDEPRVIHVWKAAP